MNIKNLESRLETLDIASGRRTLVHKDRVRFEAPNWTPDGKSLIFNQGGLLYRIAVTPNGMPVEGSRPTVIPTGFATRNNNDHGLSPDGQTLAISHHTEGYPEGADSMIYTVPVAGGVPGQVTTKAPSYWHAWSPDGSTLVYTAERNRQFDIYQIPAEGGDEVNLTNNAARDDGPDFSPDGRYIYFNSARSGRMQIWRMDADGGNPVQITDDDCNNWFPHPSPDGKQLLYLSYLDAIEPDDHPPDKNVMLYLMDRDSGVVSRLAGFIGGQGTVNVPSWSPDSRHFAFVSYRIHPD